MTSTRSNLDDVRVGERKYWLEGPPHDLFRQLRSECPVHWTDKVTEYPREKGFWSVTRADDIVHLARHRRNALEHSVGRHQHHSPIAEREEKMLGLEAIERRDQRVGMIDVEIRAHR